MNGSSMKYVTRRDGLIAIVSSGLTSPGTVFRSKGEDPNIFIVANESPFNAKGNGVADDTEALRSAFDLAIETGKTLILQGTYRVSGPLVYGRTRARGSLNLRLVDSVSIEVDKATARFDTLIHLMTEQPIQSSFSGARLTVQLNGRCACGIIVRYLSPSSLGRLVWLAQIKVYDAFNDFSNETTDNYGIAVIGRFREVTINNAVVVGVSRARAVGESKSLTVAGYTGKVTISHPYLAGVTAPDRVADVDLLALFPASEADSAWSRRSGIAFVNNGSFIDSQGRSIKLQGRAVLTDNTYVRTGKVMSMTESCEVDAQFDSIIERGATYRYTRSVAGRSPLGEHHVLLSLQHLVGGTMLASKMTRAQVFSEVPIWAGISINHALRTLNNSFELFDLTVNRQGKFSGNVFQRAIIEFDADKVAQSAGVLSLTVQNVRGAAGAPVVGYNVSVPPVTSKIEIKILDCSNSGSNVPIIDSIGGRLDLPVISVEASNNAGWTMGRKQR